MKFHLEEGNFSDQGASSLALTRAPSRASRDATPDSRSVAAHGSSGIDPYLFSCSDDSSRATTAKRAKARRGPIVPGQDANHSGPNLTLR